MVTLPYPFQVNGKSKSSHPSSRIKRIIQGISSPGYTMQSNVYKLPCNSPASPAFLESTLSDPSSDEDDLFLSTSSGEQNIFLVERPISVFWTLFHFGKYQVMNATHLFISSFWCYVKISKLDCVCGERCSFIDPFKNDITCRKAQ